MNNNNLNYKRMSLDEVLTKSSYQDTYKNMSKWLSQQQQISTQDFKTIWNDAVSPGYYDETFTTSHLDLALMAMDKSTDSKALHKIIFQTWTIDILINDLFKDFLDKYLEKILIPNLTPIKELKEIEKESLLLSVSLDISPSLSNDSIQIEDWNDKDRIISNFLSLLQSINKGEVDEKLKCFESIDTIFSKTPLFKEKIMKVFGLDESNNFLDIMVSIKSLTYSGELLHNYSLTEIFTLADRYQLQKSLSEDLKNKDVRSVKNKI